MDETTSPAAGAMSPRATHPSNVRFVSLARGALYLALAAAIAIVAYAQFQSLKAKAVLENSQHALIDNFGIERAPVRKHLAAEYTDKGGRLLADPPADAAKLLSPEPLVVAFGEDSDLEVQPIAWDEFQSHLSAATGKRVEMRVYQNTPDEVAAVKDGKIHVVALHAADTPYLVNNAGFVPVAVVGDDSGAKGNRLDIAVPPQSNIHHLADLKERMLTCTTPVSITGHRAAVAVLLQEGGLRPDVDYSINFSLSQKRSILGLVNGDYEAAALSDDKVRSLIKTGRIKEADLRIIYQSPAIPRFTIGYVYNLDPGLAAKVSEALLDFKNESGPTSEDSPNPLRFVAVDYREQFDFVRRIDESFDPRLGPKPPKQKPEAEPVGSQQST